MNSKERMLAAFKGLPFDAYPYVSRYADWSLLPHMREITGLTFLHVDYGTEEERMKCFRAMLENSGMDWLQVPE